MNEVLRWLHRNPVPYPELERRYSPQVQDVLSAACRDQRVFYFYDVRTLIRHRVWGNIAWVGADDYDISSLDRTRVLLDNMPEDRIPRLRRKLRYLRANVEEYGEWPFRIFALVDDEALAREVFHDQFSTNGWVNVFPSRHEELGRWIRRPALPPDWDTASPEQRRALEAAVRDLNTLFSSGKRRSPFVFYRLFNRSYVGLRHYYPPVLPSILALHCSNAARCQNEAGAVADAVAGEGDLRATLRPWLT